MTTSATLSLPTLVIGPESGGRSFRTLARSAELALDPVAQARLTEVPLALAEWAGHNEAACMARLPLSPQYSLLLRAKNFGMGSGGYLAFAHAVILPTGQVRAAGALAGEILALVPEPDGAIRFAEALLGWTPPPPSPPGFTRDWAQLGLEWSRTALFVPAEYELESVLDSVLAAADIEAWATTLFLRTESILPQDIFSLFVLPDSQRLPKSWPHVIALVTPRGLQGEALTVPDSWQTWQAIQMLADKSPARQSALRNAVLQPPNFRDDADAFKQLKGILRRTVDALDVPATRDFLRELIQASRVMPGPILPGLTQDAVEFVMSRTRPAEARLYLSEFARHGGLSLPYIRKLYLAPGVAGQLDSFEFKRLLAAGYCDDLLADAAPLERVDDLAPWQLPELAAALEAMPRPHGESADYLILDLLLRMMKKTGNDAGSLDRLAHTARDCLSLVRNTPGRTGAVQGLTRFVRAGNSYRNMRE